MWHTWNTEICALLGFYAAQNGGFSLMFWDNLLGLNVSMKLPFYTAWNPQTAQITFTPQQKPEIMHTWTLLKHAWNVCHTLLTHNLHFITKDFFHGNSCSRRRSVLCSFEPRRRTFITKVIFIIITWNICHEKLL